MTEPTKPKPAHKETYNRQVESMRRQCGAQFLEYMADPTVTEISRNPDGLMWLDVLGKGKVCVGQVWSDEVADAMISMTATISGFKLFNDTTGEQRLVVETEFPLNGGRFEGIFAPVAKTPTFALRKHGVQAFTFDDYRQQGFFTRGAVSRRETTAIAEELKGQEGEVILRQAITRYLNVLIVGGTNSGKTTFANTYLSELLLLCPNDRLVYAEDNRELNIAQKVLHEGQMQPTNVVGLRTQDAAGIDLIALQRVMMRLSPNRIIVGEVRGHEVRDLLSSWQTGHPGGLATIHSDTARETLARIENMIRRKETPVPSEIAGAVDLIVVIGRNDNRPQLREICYVEGYNKSSEEYNLITLYNKDI